MPKYRKLWVKVLESEDFDEMPDDFTRLLWALLPLVASREGTLPDHAMQIRSAVFPRREDVQPEQVRAALDWFMARDMIRGYVVKGRRYLWLVSWEDYQGDCSREAESNYPPVPDSVRSRSGAGQELVTSRSCSDADADADADAEAKAAAAADESEDRFPELRQQLNAEDSEDDLADYACRAWYEELGATPSKRLTADLRELAGRYADWEWWDYALSECAANNTRNVRYLERCLETALRQDQGDGAAGERFSEQDRRRYVEGKYAALFRRARDGLEEGVRAV